MKSIFYCTVMFALLSFSAHVYSNTVDEEKDPRLKAGEELYDKLFAAKDDKEKMPVALSLDKVPMTEFINLFSTVLKFDYLIDDSVTGKPVTLSIKSDKTKKEIWSLFVNTLWNSGAYCTLKDKTVYILPIEKK